MVVALCNGGVEKQKKRFMFHVNVLSELFSSLEGSKRRGRNIDLNENYPGEMVLVLPREV